ncbi:TIM barrel protein [bacterium 210820-DFI.6.52]|uniref:TIM barrel protein n=1 Tax=Bittarella massiliensis (ex Durand et al. 2017) TaxID=1720313 RepID=A0ABW9WRM4_9FIRM|nr:TIM barrel protein [Bittarella massiliensis (ex Durand et al. 2017)]MCB5941797.1 TIM barrel protein [bacterium 210820-DFI.6.52]MZL68485.1 TIM barrel protein [Bittarella massiliensis (ex Durand et al. 2017)]MZL79460.1 TIM barrel protein [Bittarella massiliensis (ex Durand et al. 2017)]
MAAKFGPAGNSQSFKDQGYKATIQAPGYVEKMGLDCYEYQCGHGVRISPEAAAAFGKKAVEHGISLSLHAPYYISLSSVEEEKRQKSVEYILQSVRAAAGMGADRVVVHSGSCSKISREEALALAGDTLQRALAAMDEEGLGHVHLCPETMGKINQLGTLDEVLSLCCLDERLIPCIDFGHLNARTLGGIAQKSDYEAILLAVGERLGDGRMKGFHAHFSKIQYTEKGGEKVHLTFADTVYGPAYEPLMELICQYGCSPTFICESAGTQAEDARTMKDYYRSLQG